MCLCMVHAKIEDCLYFYIQAFVLEKVSNILLMMVCRVKISPVSYKPKHDFAQCCGESTSAKV